MSKNSQVELVHFYKDITTTYLYKNIVLIFKLISNNAHFFRNILAAQKLHIHFMRAAVINCIFQI